MGPIEESYFFSGNQGMNTTLAAAAVSDQSSNYDSSALGGKYRRGVVRLTLPTDCGFQASPNQKQQNLIYIQGTDNYDGLHEILAATATTIDIIAPYVAETTSTGDIVRPGLKFNEAWEFCGFKLHLSAASATSENLVISVDADRGAAWDFNIFTEDMNGVQDRSEKYGDGEIIILANDILYVTWTNTNDKTWGLELIAKRQA